jgi:hypothetical protein
MRNFKLLLCLTVFAGAFAFANDDNDKKTIISSVIENMHKNNAIDRVSAKLFSWAAPAEPNLLIFLGLMSLGAFNKFVIKPTEVIIAEPVLNYWKKAGKEVVFKNMLEAEKDNNFDISESLR